VITPDAVERQLRMLALAVAENQQRLNNVSREIRDWEFDGNVTLPSNTVFGATWDDVRVSASAVKVGPTKTPGFGEFPSGSGLYTYLFDGGTSDEYVYFTCQLPHKYKPGTDLKPHVHFAPTNANAGDVKWFLEYTWENYGGSFSASPNTATGTETVAAGTAYKHMICGLGTISGSGKKESSMLICKIYRDPTDSDDTYASDAAFLEIDFHYQSNKRGTVPEYPS